MSKKNKTTTGPSEFAQPFIQQGAGALSNEFNNTIGDLRANSSEVSGLLSDFSADRLQNGDPGVNAAKGYGADVLAGNYLEGNPYLDDIISQSNNDILNQTQAAMGLKGLTGGSDYAGIIGDRIAENTLGLRYNDYNTERGRMDSAADRSTSLAAADYLPVNGLMSSIQAQQAPLNAASQYAGGLGGLLGGYQTQTQPSGLVKDLLGTAAQVGSAALMASERSVKKNIQQVGTLPDGLGIYDFQYKWEGDDAAFTRGVMVDEVQDLRPWALGPKVSGIQTVDYSKLEAA